MGELREFVFYHRGYDILAVHLGPQVYAFDDDGHASFWPNRLYAGGIEFVLDMEDFVRDWIFIGEL